MEDKVFSSILYPRVIVDKFNVTFYKGDCKLKFFPYLFILLLTEATISHCLQETVRILRAVP